MSDIIYQDELLKMAGVGQQKRLIDWLNRNKIRYIYSNGDRKVLTTIQAVNDAISGNHQVKIEFGNGSE